MRDSSGVSSDGSAEVDIASIFSLAKSITLTGNEGNSEADILQIAESAIISGPAKLLMLTALKKAGFTPTEVLPLAQALVLPELGPKAALQLFDAIDPDADDPLGRNVDTYFLQTIDPWSKILIPDVLATIVHHVSHCDATTEDRGGVPVLHIENTSYSSHPLSDFTKLVDPLEWPNCPIQALFFKEMVAKQKMKLPPPDQGWRAVVTETVDFGAPIGEMKTDLDMMYFTSQNSTGSTYKLNKSVDGQISYDEGFLLVEDLELSIGARRATSLKMVRFTNPAYNLPASAICPIWSLAVSVITLSCLDD